jgi:hypothetical protein
MLFLVCLQNLNPCPPDQVNSLPISDLIDWTALGINAPEILYVFSWGFGAVLMSWLLGYGVLLAIGLIRKL